MSQLKEKKPLIEKLKIKYRLTISNEATFDEVLSIRLSRLNVVAVTTVFSVVLIALITLLIAFTPLREYIPGYPDGEMRRNIEKNNILVDSLISELDKRDRFFQGIKNVISGNDFDNESETAADSVTDPRYKNFDFKKSSADSLFRKQHEEDEKYNLTVQTSLKAKGLSNTHFFSPLKGMISSHFDTKKAHYGTDIVGGMNERISAVLSGTIVLSEWTLNTGYVIQIQHANNLISVYKHNSELLKKAGEQVKAGEAIALLGNSGELTSGPHLHFELWHNGRPINPEDYIKF
jgi:murein DD-endopeptidase MepM/ murein hydrolase activator NlpD